MVVLEVAPAFTSKKKPAFYLWIRKNPILRFIQNDILLNLENISLDRNLNRKRHSKYWWHFFPCVLISAYLLPSFSVFTSI